MLSAETAVSSGLQLPHSPQSRFLHDLSRNCVDQIWLTIRLVGYIKLLTTIGIQRFRAAVATETPRCGHGMIARPL